MFCRRKSTATSSEHSLNSEFVSLSPIDDDSNATVYTPALDFAFQHKDICNIAVSGMYGAGKSSILRTYFKEKKKKVLWVSLATFLNSDLRVTSSINSSCSQNATSSFSPSSIQDHAEKENAGGSINENLLETGILQQLVCAVIPHKLLSARFLRTTANPWWQPVLWLLWIGGIVFGLAGVVQPHVLSSHFPQYIRHDLLPWRHTIFWISNIVLALLFSIAFWKVYRWFKCIRIRHIEAKGVHLELGETGEESIITRHMEDIVCLFETTDCKIVVFEDIDRFNDIGIFTKLREINLILNSSMYNSKPKNPVRFVYALRDDLFVNETEKTKFFDFIIPVVPVINTSNSRDALMQLIPTKTGEESDDEHAKKIEDRVHQFAQDVSPFLSDMRLLKNIRNELAIYRKVIPSRANPEKLLGMVVFKNFFPRDFALLHSDTGILGELIRARASILKGAQLALVEKEENILAEIRIRQKEASTDLEHLQLSYWGALWKAIGNANIQVVVNNQVCSIHNLPHVPGGFEALQNGTLKIRFQQKSFPGWKQVEDYVDSQHSYSERAQLIMSNKQETLSALHKALDEIRGQKESMTNMSVSELLQEEILKQDDIIQWLDNSHHHLEKNDLGLFLVLLRKGYIDENYRYYISWISASKSPQDYYFELEVSQRGNADIYLNLDNPKEVLRSLRPKDFETKAILNLSLFKEIVVAKDEKYKTMIQLLSTCDPDCCQFLDAYLSIEEIPLELRKKVFLDVVQESPNYLEKALALHVQEQLSRASLYSIVGFYLLQFYESEQEVLNPKIKLFLEEEAKVRRVVGPAGLGTPELFENLINKAHLKFSTLDSFKFKDDKLLMVAQNLCAYRLIPWNLEIAMGELYRTDLQHSNYTTICEHANEDLQRYVNNNFNEYVENVYCQLEEPQQEKPEWIAKVLNRNDLSLAIKQKFLSKLKSGVKIPSTALLLTPDSVILALEHNVLEVTWGNLAEIASRDGEDDVRGMLCRFVGKQETQCQLDRESRPVSWSPDLRRLATLVAQTSEMTDDMAIALLDKFPGGQIDWDERTPVTESRIRLLIQKHRVAFSVELYNQLKEAKTGAHLVLGAMKWKKLQKAVADKQITLDDDEIDAILDSEDLKSQNRAAILEYQKTLSSKGKQ